MDNHLRIHFLRVGDGDCTIVELPDNRIMMVDIMNGRIGAAPNSNYTNPIHHLNQYFSGYSIHRYVQTHPDMDHMDGFADLIKNYQIFNFWDTDTHKNPDDFTIFREEDWTAYKNAKKGRILNVYRQTDPIISDSGGYVYNIYPISPTTKLIADVNSSDNTPWNKASYVVLLQYGGFKLLLGGDAEKEVWEEIYDWANTDSKAKALLQDINVFKVSHHGRDTGYCTNEMLQLMTPQQIISDYSPLVKDSANSKYEYYRDNSQSLVNIRDIDKQNFFVDYTLHGNYKIYGF